MLWNWQHSSWPEFSYDTAVIREAEEAFLHHSGMLFGAFTHLSRTRLTQSGLTF